MKRKPIFCFPALLAMILLSPGLSAQPEETIFASYFDIPVNSGAGTEVIGRIHVARNKDVRQSPVPAGYHFEIVHQEGKIFTIETRYDLSNRIMGVLLVDRDQNTGGIPVLYQVTVVLKNNDQVLKKSKLSIHVVEETLWTTLYQRYKDHTVSERGSRMYGRNIYSDQQVQRLIGELEAGNGRFTGINSYDHHPSDYLNEIIVDPVSERRYAAIEHEWEKVAAMIGGLGYAYAKSETYGPNGNIPDRERLRKALYSALLAYTRSVPVEGDDILVHGEPLGPHTGDGFIRLSEHGLVSHALATHHWRILDPLVAPAVHLMPELLEEMKNGDQQAEMVYNSLIRYYQLAMSVILSRRAIDDPDQRWGKITDTIYSEGAWADANLGHRLRVLLALPIIWADYNRPMTYVSYWYSDFYGGKPYEGFSFSPGWSPHGVVPDLQRWLKKFYLPAHRFRQSGFHPDGTVSHHTGHASDAAMLAYGFSWLTEAFIGYNQFKNTAYQLGDSYYQFPADRLIRVYGKLFYKGQMDFVIAGRSFLSDMDQFRERTFIPAIDSLLVAKSCDTRIKNEEALLRLHDAIKYGMHEYSGTDAYWIPEFLVHRRGENEASYYASVKLKSERVVGAEDFGKVRRSWHAGSGVLLLRITGKEYAHSVLGNMDWHMLPGITEEWRTDPLPAQGGAQASLPGLNEISGVLSDGSHGMAIYHHLPGETYSAATALKSYYFLENKVIALGSDIRRYREGQQKGIYTCIDQSSMGSSDLSYSIDGHQAKITAGESTDLRINMREPLWIHHNDKGYFLFPAGEQELVIKTGDKINLTDGEIANGDQNFILAIGHGGTPGSSPVNRYYYVLVPNIKVHEMPAMLTRIERSVNVQTAEDSIHWVSAELDSVTQVAFFKKGRIRAGKSLEIGSSVPAMVMMVEHLDSWTISVGDPRADPDLETITLHVSTPMEEGTYEYQLPGVYPRPGETATVSAEKDGSRIVIEMPDKRDEAYYNYQAALYAGAPVVLSVPKKKSAR